MNTPRYNVERHELILQHLRQHGSVSVKDLAQQFQVAELTIRRDLSTLANRGLITRVHGGATLRSSLDTSVPSAQNPAWPAKFRLGMVVPSLHYYWPGIVNGARAAATLNGATLVLRGASYELSDQRDQIANLIQSGNIHGLLVGPNTHGPEGLALLEWLDSLPIPVVLVERTSPRNLGLQKIEWVTTDHTSGAITAVKHLTDQGHRRIALALEQGSPTSAHLKSGWHRALVEEGCVVEDSIFVELTDEDQISRTQQFADLLQACQENNVTAILMHSDPKALMFESYCHDVGIRVPEDLALVAYDDEIAANGEPPLTALRPAKHHIGRMAVETLLARLNEGDARPIQRVQVLPELIVRDSSVVRDSTAVQP